MPAWRSTERVRTLPHCKLSRAGNLRLSQPLSLPGAQRQFALCPAANFSEQSRKPAPCTGNVAAWRSTERVCTPPSCKLSRAGSPCLARPLSLPRAQRGFAFCPAANFTQREACALPVHCPCLEHRESLHSAPLQTFQSGKPAPCPSTVPAQSTERVWTPPHCKLYRAGSLRLARPL